MIPNKNPELDKQLKKIWQDSVERLVKQKATKKNYPHINLIKAPINLEGLKEISKEIAEAAETVIFEKKGVSVAIASVNPEAEKAKAIFEDLKIKGRGLKIYMISKQSLEYALGFYEYIPQKASQITSKVDISVKRVESLKKAFTSLAKVGDRMKKRISELAPTKDLIEITLAGAMATRGSDVHFEAGEEGGRVRYRIDGVLQTVTEGMPLDIYKRIISRIKLLSNLRLNVDDVSQDGRFTIGLSDFNIEMRVSIVPSEYGEAIVMRILDPRAIQIEISDLGIRKDDLEVIQRELKAPNGMILNTGPTGSGKTTSLYAFLRSINDSDTKIITIEDPIEYHMNGIEQTQVDKEAGYTFANGLQAMLRQDPDVILVGEIRDEETAGIATQASLTGHLVFSTLHTNSAAGVIPRLLDLKAPATSIGPALNLIIAQRLVRRLCKKCKEKDSVSAELQKEIDKFLKALPKKVERPKEIILYKPKGCAVCNGTGYKGRMGIFELLEADQDIEELINKKAGEGEIFKFGRERGLVTLQEDGILRVLSGNTSFEEVEEVSGVLKNFKWK